MKALGILSIMTLAGAGSLSAQFGVPTVPIGAGAVEKSMDGATDSQRSDALDSAPILSESGLVLEDGWAVNSFVSSYEVNSLITDGFTIDDLVLTSTALSLSGVIAPSPDFMLGATLRPYLSVSAESQAFGNDEDSGTGDASIFAKYRLHQSDDGRTSVAATGAVSLPIGSDNSDSGGLMFGQYGASFGATAGVSHRLADGSPLSLHGSLGFTVPTDEMDGEAVVNFSGAGVYRTSPKFALSGEVLGASSDGEYIVNLAPGGRITAGSNFLVDLALALNVASSSDVSPFEYGFFLGGTYIP